MRNVPILDKAYMENRARTRYFSEYMRALRSVPLAPQKQPAEVVRDDYLTGAISIEVFEARLDAIFGLKR